MEEEEKIEKKDYTKPKKVSVELCNRTYMFMDALKDSMAAKSYSEVVRRSVTLAGFLLLQMKKGNEIIIRDKHGKERNIIDSAFYLEF